MIRPDSGSRRIPLLPTRYTLYFSGLNPVREPRRWRYHEVTWENEGNFSQSSRDQGEAYGLKVGASLQLP